MKVMSNYIFTLLNATGEGVETEIIVIVLSKPKTYNFLI